MVTTPEDILRNLGWDTGNILEKAAGPEVDLEPDEKKLLYAINEVPGITPGDLGRLISKPVHQVLAMLLEMELKGWISVEPGNRYRSRIKLHF